MLEKHDQSLPYLGCLWVFDVSRVNPGQTFNTRSRSFYPQCRYLSHGFDPISLSWPGSVFVYSRLKELTFQSAAGLSCQCNRLFLLCLSRAFIFLSSPTLLPDHSVVCFSLVSKLLKSFSSSALAFYLLTTLHSEPFPESCNTCHFSVLLHLP